MALQWSLLVHGGVLVPADPGSAAAFLRSSTPAAYTTTRTTDGGSILLLWERHLARLSQSLQLLASTYPNLYPSLRLDGGTSLEGLVRTSLLAGLAEASRRRSPEEEINLTVLLAANHQTPTYMAGSSCEVYVHASNYKPLPKGRMPLATGVAVMGPGRELASAKSSLWARTRQTLEKLRPAGASEIILSNDGESLLEGTLTNFFVVAKVGDVDDVEVQTASLEDGVLPGVIRSLVIEVCRESGIRLREAMPRWSHQSQWTEAFVTSSVRIVQPVAHIQFPTEWIFGPTIRQGEMHWQRAELQACGVVTQKIHMLVLQRARQLSTHIPDLFERS